MTLQSKRIVNQSGGWMNLGRMAYLSCWKLQVRLAEEVAAGNREDTLLFVEHDPVLTLGSSFHEENLLLPRTEYAKQGIEVVRTDRGGDVTYHGPGQLVIYPIFDLNRHGKDLHRWLRGLEETMLLTLQEFGLEGYRFSPNTGAWVNQRKIAAIGVKVKRWVNLHGIALNCNNDLSPFSLIVPCGIRAYPVTSLSTELERPVSPSDALPVVLKTFERVFGLNFTERAWSSLETSG